MVEVFGDDRIVSCGGRWLGSALTTRKFKLLDLRDPDGAWRAGSVSAICSCTERIDSQAWSAYFYATYLDIDGLIYGNAHNGATAFALYERADGALVKEQEMPLSDYRLRPRLLSAVESLGMTFVDE